MFVWRFLRRLLAQFIRLLFLNRAVTLGLLAVIVVGFVIVPLLSRSGNLPGGLSPAGMLGSGQAAQAAASTDSGQATASSQALPQEPSVQTYIKGMTTYDANLMWSSLDARFRNQLQTNGVTVDTMKAQVSQKQKAGVKYDNVYYIGSYEGKTGLRYYFYAITYSGVDSSGQAVSSEDAITFTVAPDTGAIFDIGIK